MLSRKLPRPRLLMIVLLVVAAVLCVPITQGLIDLHSRHVASHMRDLATRIAVPAGLSTVSRGQCSSQEFLVACWTSPQSPDQLAATFAAALSQAVGDEVTTRCETMPFGSRPRSCDVAFVARGNHALSVGIDTDAKLQNGRMVTMGSRIRIDAD